MLAIRLQRLGRSGYPTYRIAVQESQRHPSSGRVVAYIGSFNPHSKETTLDLDKVAHYLANGAQPTPRVVRILNEQKVSLPSWVKSHGGDKKVAIKHAEKLRKNRPVEEKPADVPVEAEPAADEPVADEPVVETPTEPTAE